MEAGELRIYIIVNSRITKNGILKIVIQISQSNKKINELIKLKIEILVQ
jgi:hypothetical protein